MPGKLILRILCCTLVAGIGLSLFPESPTKKGIRLLVGLFLLLTMLQPGVLPELPDLEAMLWEYRLLGQEAASEGTATAEAYRLTLIKEALDAYILDKAASLGCALTASVTLDGEGCPQGVVLTGSATPDARQKLEAILWEELGIAKEDQQWIGQQILPPSENG